MSSKIAHFGVYGTNPKSPVAPNANAGDTLLFQATRDLFETFLGKIEWDLRPLWKEITTEEISVINKNNDAVLIGGGGLFLRDQAGADASRSGWQWNCSEQEVRSFSIPIIMFGVGYNRFRNQPDFEPVFSKHIEALAEKSVFFGLRNHGSIYSIRRYLPTHLHHKIIYQPCPTTVSSYIYPSLNNRAEGSGKRLALNVAFDRVDMRFQNKDAVLTQIAEVMKSCVGDGWEIVLANHKPQDAEIKPFLDKIPVPYSEENLSDMVPEEILEFYKDKDLTVGMRGHAQMIPFGMKKPIVSIVSHDKMGWFLDDIGHPEWGVDVEEEDFGDRLYQAIRGVSDNPNIRQQLEIAQKDLWDKTTSNMEKIKGLLGRS